MAYDEKIKKKVQILYEKGSTFKAILEQYKIPAKTIRQWASKYKWEREKGSKKSTETKQLRINKGGAPEKNTNAIKHGLFSKYLPAETLELVGTIEMMSPLDILWENICLKYAAIIRSQKIMYVKDDKDVTKRITMDGAEATAYQYIEAYDKQATFLMAQSRAMGTLMNLIKQYEEMCNSELATEEQKLRIEKLKTEITKATDEEPVKVEIIDNISNVEVNTNANKFE
nr:MAG TPA: Small Terminase [Caudoviricetes sp.]